MCGLNKFFLIIHFPSNNNWHAELGERKLLMNSLKFFTTMDWQIKLAPKHSNCALKISVGLSHQYIIKEGYPILEYLALYISELVKLDQFSPLQENEALPVIMMKGMKLNCRNKASHYIRTISPRYNSYWLKILANEKISVNGCSETES